MYERLKRLYLDGKLTKAQLQKAVDKGWITKAEMKEILNSK